MVPSVLQQKPETKITVFAVFFSAGSEAERRNGNKKTVIDVITVCPRVGLHGGTVPDALRMVQKDGGMVSEPVKNHN